MTLGLWKYAAAIAVAIAATMSTASANDLKMYLQNNTAGELFYNQSSNVKSGYPTTIAKGAKSSEIQSEGEDKGSVGSITYANSTTPGDITCAVTVEFAWTYNSVTGHCDNKNFTLVNTGACTVVKAGNCDGENSCSCHFTASGN
jgi:hypothetical protein